MTETLLTGTLNHKPTNQPTSVYLIELNFLLSIDLYNVDAVVSPDARKRLSYLIVTPLAVGRTGAVASVADYGPRGPWFETWPRHSLLWP